MNSSEKDPNAFQTWLQELGNDKNALLLDFTPNYLAQTLEEVQIRNLGKEEPLTLLLPMYQPFLSPQ